MCCSSREDKDRWCNLDVTWTVCYPWACTSSRLRIGTPGIARLSSTPKSWLRDGRNLPPEVLCWDIFWPTLWDRIPWISGAQPEKGLCCKGEYRRNRKQKERGRTCARLCVWEEATSNFVLAPLAGIWNDDEKWSYICDLKIAVFSIVPWKICCSVELINV